MEKEKDDLWLKERMDKCKHNSKAYLKHRNELLLSVSHLIYSIVDNFRKRNNFHSRDDLIQHCFVESIDIIDKWNPQRAKFNTYLWRCLTNKLCDYSLKNSHQVKISNSYIRKHGKIIEISEESVERNLLSETESVENIVCKLESEQYCKEKNTILSSLDLSDREKEVIELLKGGYIPKDKKEQKVFSHKIYSVRKKVKDYRDYRDYKEGSRCGD
jgi:RNA polymerase sigma factor (sigma-70 family)